MKALVIGGSGYIGGQIVDTLLRNGNQVSIVGRSQPSGMPDDVAFHQGDASSLCRDEWTQILQGHDALVFAAGADSRTNAPRPSGPYFHTHNVESVRRLMEAARLVGIGSAVILGSYNVTLHRLHPKLKLAQRNPYIASRVAQAVQARRAAGPDCPVAVLEIPFVFGSTSNRPHHLIHLVPWLSGETRLPLMAPPGGTALVTAAAIGDATCKALATRLDGDYPVAQANLTWSELVSRLARAAGNPRPDVIKKVPASAFAANMRVKGLLRRLRGGDNGLHPWHYPKLFTSNMFIPERVPELGIDDSDLDTALRAAVTVPPAATGQSSTPKRSDRGL